MAKTQRYEQLELWPKSSYRRRTDPLGSRFWVSDLLDMEGGGDSGSQEEAFEEDQEEAD